MIIVSSRTRTEPVVLSDEFARYVGPDIEDGIWVRSYYTDASIPCFGLTCSTMGTATWFVKLPREEKGKHTWHTVSLGHAHHMSIRSALTLGCQVAATYLVSERAVRDALANEWGASPQTRAGMRRSVDVIDACLEGFRALFGKGYVERCVRNPQPFPSDRGNRLVSALGQLTLPRVAIDPPTEYNRD